MPTLEERREETPEMLETRLCERAEDFGITMEFARYIESMEIYFLELEQRLEALERPDRDNMNIIRLERMLARKLNAS